MLLECGRPSPDELCGGQVTIDACSDVKLIRCGRCEQIKLWGQTVCPGALPAACLRGPAAH